jgi:hypothetical protein
MTRWQVILPPFQIIGRVGFSRHIVFAMYLDRCKANAVYLEKLKRPIIWNGDSSI